ncbi:MAG TPA: hypothetical protein VH583_01250 [Vicinamibacterales bacterium]|jgi:hypothetical protein
MKPAVLVVLSATLAGVPLLAQQESKPVPKDSVRVSVPGCTKNYIFTAGPRTAHEPGNFEIPEGMHLRMNGPKKLISDIKAHEGSMIELTGLMKKGQYNEGINLGGGVRVSPGTPPTSTGGMMPSATVGQITIDVETWRPLEGSCPSR